MFCKSSRKQKNYASNMCSVYKKFDCVNFHNFPIVLFPLDSQPKASGFSICESDFEFSNVRADAQTIQTKLSAQLAVFMKPDFRAGVQTTTKLTAQLTTFMRTEVRADAQTTTELTALTIQSINLSIEHSVLHSVNRSMEH